MTVSAGKHGGPHLLEWGL